MSQSNKSFAKKNKTRWALSVFETEEILEYPDYIARVIEWCDEK